jgi:hypothetical protein
MSFTPSSVNGPSTPKGIVAAAPRVQFGIAQGQKLTVPVGEALHLFIPATHGHDLGISTVSGPRFIFIVAPRKQPPPGVGAPRIAGQWFEIWLSSLAEGHETQVVRLQSGVSSPQPHTRLTFTLVGGGKRFY